jgi:hypothetical protein
MLELILNPYSGNCYYLEVCCHSNVHGLLKLDVLNTNGLAHSFFVYYFSSFLPCFLYFLLSFLLIFFLYLHVLREKMALQLGVRPLESSKDCRRRRTQLQTGVFTID